MHENTYTPPPSPMATRARIAPEFVLPVGLLLERKLAQTNSQAEIYRQDYMFESRCYENSRVERDRYQTLGKGTQPRPAFLPHYNTRPLMRNKDTIPGQMPCSRKSVSHTTIR